MDAKSRGEGVVASPCTAASCPRPRGLGRAKRGDGVVVDQTTIRKCVAVHMYMEYSMACVFDVHAPHARPNHASPDEGPWGPGLGPGPHPATTKSGHPVQKLAEETPSQ